MKEFVLCCLCLVIAGCGLDQSTSQADKPISREAASTNVDIPFPISAINIYYIFHAGGLQEYQLFVRFTVEPGGESNAVDEILADHNKRTRRFDSYPSVSVANMMSSADQGLSPMPWWNLDLVTNGYSRGSANGQPFYIWADLSQHAIYVHASD
jgi:hypothetical protein